MKFAHVSLALAFAALAACSRQQTGAATDAVASQPASPPIAAKRPYEVKSPHGVRNDPYYWLRDDTRKDPEVLAYLEAETQYAAAMLAPVRDLQDKLYEEIVARIPPDDATVPYEHGPYWYYQRYELGKEHPIHVRRKGSPEGPEQVLLDVNQLAEGKGYYHVASLEPSPDHRFIAFAEDSVGRRQHTLRVLDTTTGKLLPDQVTNAQPDIAWTSDNRSFLYIEKDPVTLLGKRVKRHVLGTEPASDTLVYEEPDPSFYIRVTRSVSGKYIYVFMEGTLTTEYRFADAADPKLELRTAIPRESGHEYHLADLGERFIMLTNWQAPNFRIVSVPVAKVADRGAWREVVPHRDDVFLHDYAVFQDYLAVNERSAGLRKIRIQPWKGGKDYVVASEEPAYVMYLDVNRNQASGKLRYKYTSLTTPFSYYELDMRTGERTLLKREPVLGGFDSANYRTEYLEATARDGVKVPVSILYRTGFEKDGTAPCYQYGYGSYGLTTDPDFASDWISLVDRGFVVAMAHIRGGQEKGRAWYDAGRLLNKKNTFTDFIDVTRFLVEQKFCDRERVFAMGGSAGGLLMGAIANMAPQDYRGIVAYVPFVDVVTTMLDESIPLTTNEFNEWGNPKEQPYYDYMLSYSPYDNVKAQAYPAMLVITGLWDSQVQYYEPAKWVAKLRAMHTGSTPILFHVDMEAGHSGKPGRYERYRDTAREYAFILQQAGLH